MSESAGHSYLQTHEIAGSALLLDLNDESKAILEEARAAGVGHAAKTLVREGPLRVVILGLKAGSIVRDHRAGGPVSLHVLSGHVEVLSGGRGGAIQAGRALVFGSNVPHSLEAKADSVVLVTIAWQQS